jgi:hypothetical protein
MRHDPSTPARQSSDTRLPAPSLCRASPSRLTSPSQLGPPGCAGGPSPLVSVSSGPHRHSRVSSACLHPAGPRGLTSRHPSPPLLTEKGPRLRHKQAEPGPQPAQSPCAPRERAASCLGFAPRSDSAPRPVPWALRATRTAWSVVPRLPRSPDKPNIPLSPDKPNLPRSPDKPNLPLSPDKPRAWRRAPSPGLW